MLPRPGEPGGQGLPQDEEVTLAEIAATGGNVDVTRRNFLTSIGLAAAGVLAGCSAEDREAYFQRHFQELSSAELQARLSREQTQLTARFGKDVHVTALPHKPGVTFGYALDLARCIGCRRCVYACTKENNQSRVHLEYLFHGIHGHHALVPYAWAFVFCGIAAFLLFLVPTTRRNVFTLNLGCLLIYASVYIEKGMGTVIPGLTPDTLGEIYEYTPTLHELRIGAGIFAVGFLVFTLLCKVAIPIMTGEFQSKPASGAAPAAAH